ncbi:TPA: hypothetical protein BOS_16687 [Bos taurus]|nr:TPA: hypothetical protein BOS_16687 [Bos taurus]
MQGPLGAAFAPVDAQERNPKSFAQNLETGSHLTSGPSAGPAITRTDSRKTPQAHPPNPLSQRGRRPHHG